MRFEPAPEYKVFPTADTPGLKPYQAAVRAARETQPLIEEFAPDAVVADILTVAAGLAAELAGVRWASLVPHVLPTPEPGFPPFAIGARLPRTRVGSTMWRGFRPPPPGRRGGGGGRPRRGGGPRRAPPPGEDHGGGSGPPATIAR